MKKKRKKEKEGGKGDAFYVPRLLGMGVLKDWETNRSIDFFDSYLGVSYRRKDIIIIHTTDPGYLSSRWKRVSRCGRCH